MKILVNELNKYIDLSKIDIKVLVSTLNRIGFEVENYYPTTKISGAKVGKILEVIKHPNADKLNFCKVLSDNQEWEVVCGAFNLRKNQLIIHAIPGSKVGDMELNERKIRGIYSSGMIVSVAEILNSKAIDLTKFIESPEIDDIFELTGEEFDNIKTKNPFEIIGVNGYVIDVSILPDRRYTNNYIRLARELNVFLEDAPLFLEENHLNKLNINVKLKKNLEKTPSYLVYKLKLNNSNTNFNVKKMLYFNSIKPSNTILDIVIYVELITGFDLNILISESFQSEWIEMKKIPNNKDLFLHIYNNKNNVEIPKEDLEFAFYLFINKSKESNYITDVGSDEAIIFNSTEKIKETYIEFTKNELEKYIGNISTEKFNYLVNKLNLLGLKYDGKSKFKILNYRRDIVNFFDILEESLRVLDINKIASKKFIKSKGNINPKFSNKIGKKYKLQDVLIRNGFFEIKTYNLISKKAMEISKIHNISELKTKQDRSLPYKELADNYLSNEYKYLRPSLISSLIDTFVFNYRNKNFDIRLFEIGTIFIYENEFETMSIIHDENIIDNKNSTHPIKYDTSDMKNEAIDPILGTMKILYELIDSLGLECSKLERRPSTYEGANKVLEQNNYVTLYYDGIYIGIIGRVNNQILRNNKLIRVDKVKRELYYLELIINNIL